MNNLNINSILGREQAYKKIKIILDGFQENKTDITLKRGIYIYGNPGSGKTEFVVNLLREQNYDIIKYDAGDIRNKSIIDTITKHNMSDKNIMSMFEKKVKKIVIVMDEIDAMNNGDKSGINSLIKLIRPKKTKKQKVEEVSFNPIICIGNYQMNKKIKELMKVCHTFELKTPSNEQISSLLLSMNLKFDKVLNDNIILFIQGDLRKLVSIHQMAVKENNILQNDIIETIFQPKSYNDDSKKLTQHLINNSYPIEQHKVLMNETDRTTVALLWHENIIDVLAKYKKDISIPFYQTVLDNICFADYIDRITFQNQAWQFNEMSSLIKTFYNNKLYHEQFIKKPKFNPVEVRFTKVLTKYSTEYNNSLFIKTLCQQLSMDQKDMFSFFMHIKTQHSEDEIYNMLENYEITKLDINRIYRYLDKYTQKTLGGTNEEDKMVDSDDDMDDEGA
jgi:DNA polymerase III delta prime subunit